MLKGNAFVGQSGGPTAAINATLAGVIKGAFDSEAIDVIYGAHNGVEGMLEGRITNLNEVFKTEMDLKTYGKNTASYSQILIMVIYGWYDQRGFLITLLLICSFQIFPNEQRLLTQG